MSLYNIYRPDTFGDVQGHETVIDSLTQNLLKGTNSNAYIMAGQKGTGKTTVAKLMAKFLSCDSPNGYEPCNVCKSCISASAEAHSDILEIDGASNNGVDDIRRLKDDIKYPPMNGKYKIYIIDEVHMLSINAFNALLKTIEQPPKYVIFIFATTELHKIPATIKSRCEIHTFTRMKLELISSRLKYIAEKENLNLLPEAADLLAKNADGSMRDAISILESLTHNEVIDTSIVMASLGLIEESFTDGFVDSMMTRDTQVAIALYQGVLEKGKTASQLIESIIELLVYRMMRGEKVIEYSRFLKEITKFKRESAHEKNIQLTFNLFIAEYTTQDASDSTVDNKAVVELIKRFNEFEKSIEDRVFKIEDWITRMVNLRKKKAEQSTDSKIIQEPSIDTNVEENQNVSNEQNVEPSMTNDDTSHVEDNKSEMNVVVEVKKEVEKEVTEEEVNKKQAVRSEIKTVDNILSRLKSYGA